MATSEGIPSSIDIEFLELNDNPYLGYPGIKTLGYKGLCIMMPLTPKLLIMFYDSDVYKVGTRKGKVDINKQNEIEEINKLIASEAYELLVYNPKYHITSSVKEYALMYVNILKV